MQLYTQARTNIGAPRDYRYSKRITQEKRSLEVVDVGSNESFRCRLRETKRGHFELRFSVIGRRLLSAIFLATQIANKPPPRTRGENRALIGNKNEMGTERLACCSHLRITKLSSLSPQRLNFLGNRCSLSHLALFGVSPSFSLRTLTIITSSLTRKRLCEIAVRPFLSRYPSKILVKKKNIPT